MACRTTRSSIGSSSGYRCSQPRLPPPGHSRSRVDSPGEQQAMQVESVAKIHILLLEDDPDLQAPLPSLLERQHGFRVSVSTTPFGEAGSAAKRLQPDVAVIGD